MKKIILSKTLTPEYDFISTFLELTTTRRRQFRTEWGKPMRLQTLIHCASATRQNNLYVLVIRIMKMAFQRWEMYNGKRERDMSALLCYK